MDERYDLGVNVFMPTPRGSFEGNLLGPDESYDAKGQRYYPIPQGGMIRRLGEQWTLGFSLFAAGLGPDYERSPYTRFGGGPRASVTLISSGVASALAWQPHPDHAIGFSLNLGYQVLRVEGLEFAQNTLPLLRVSETPDKTTNQGYDGRPNIGASVDWHGLLAPGLAAGVAYRSKSWADRHRDYRGLLPDRGSLELPAIWGGGIAWMPVSRLTLAYDFQRYEFAEERATGNRFASLQAGNMLGSKNGPGFGYRNLNAHKFGVVWLAAQKLTLRAGYIRANQPTRPSETLLNIVGSVNATTHYTGGMTWDFGGWEVSGVIAHAPAQRTRGENSIPLIFGGGEASTSFAITSVGVSFGWGLGG